MVWHFIGVYIINRKLHGRLRDEISPIMLKNISPVCCARSWNIFQHSKRNFVSLCGHVISSISFWHSYYYGQGADEATKLYSTYYYCLSS